VLKDNVIRQIPTATLGAWAMAQIGIDPNIKFSQQTYRKHREILRAYGVDLDADVRMIQFAKR